MPGRASLRLEDLVLDPNGTATLSFLGFLRYGVVAAAGSLVISTACAWSRYLA